MKNIIYFAFAFVVSYLVSLMDFHVTKNGLQGVMALNGLFLLMTVYSCQYDIQKLWKNAVFFFINTGLFLYALNVDNSLMKMSTVLCLLNILNSITISNLFFRTLNINR